MKPVKDFLGKPAPPGYVAGAGRVGFTTRPDAVGEARPEIEEGGMDDNGLLAGSNDPEDVEADRIYSAIDSKMADRRRKKMSCNADIKNDSEVFSLFKDAKRDLSLVSEAEWMNIPEAGDQSRKRLKKHKMERFTPVPDSLMLSNSSMYSGVVEEDMALVKERMLGASLDRVIVGSSHPESPCPSIDTLQSTAISTGNIDRAKSLIKGILRGNPKNPSGWIAAIRLEEASGRLRVAKGIAEKSLQVCGDEWAELWIENARLSANDQRRMIIDEGLRACPRSEALWTFAINSEAGEKDRLIRNALRSIPRSVSLWTMMIGQCEKDDLKTRLALLGAACEACPHHVDFWVKLIELESAERARAALNTAIRQNPSSLELWLTAIKLQALASFDDFIQKVFDNCNLSIDLFDRIDQIVEKFGDSVVLRAIVKRLLPASTGHSSPYIRKVITEMSLVDADEGKWLAAIKKDCYLIPSALRMFPSSVQVHSFWIESMESEAAKILAIREVLQKIPNERLFYKMLFRLTGDPQVVDEALSKVPDGELHYEKVLLLKGADDYYDFLKSSIDLYPGYEPLWLLYLDLHPEAIEKALLACPKGVYLWTRMALSCTSGPIPKLRAQLEKAMKVIPKNEILHLLGIRHSQSPHSIAQALKECPESGLLHTEAIFQESRPLRRSRAVNALRLRPDDPNILCAIGRLLEIEGKVLEAQIYFQKALMSAGQYADIYAHAFVHFKRTSSHDCGYDGDLVYKLFKENRPRISAYLLGVYEFSLDELLERLMH